MPSNFESRGSVLITTHSEVAAGRITQAPDDIGVGVVSHSSRLASGLLVSVASLSPLAMPIGAKAYAKHPASSSPDFPPPIALREGGRHHTS